MEITNTGKLLDPEVLQGMKIVEIIYALIYQQCKSVKSEFPREQYHMLAIAIFTMVKFANPVVSDISDYIYKVETQNIGLRGNRERCLRLAQTILVLQPFISDNIAWDEYRLILRKDFVSPA
jgi:hypothetical protein